MLGKYHLRHKVGRDFEKQVTSKNNHIHAKGQQTLRKKKKSLRVHLAGSSVKHATLDLRVVNLTPTLDAQIAYLNKL